MDKRSLTGLGTALVTPFCKDGSVDFDALKNLLDKQLNGHVDYLVVLGTTAEAATMSAEEKKEVRQFIAKHVHGRIPLVLGLGGNNTAQVIHDLQAMKDELLLHYAAILSVCPYYNKPSQEGLYQHFCTIAQASPIPVILYNVPGRTGVNILPETVMRIYCAYPQKIIGIKEASGNIDQIKHLIALNAADTTPNADRLLVISGDDGIASEVMQAGGDGLISVASNAWPEDFYSIVHHKDHALQAKYEEMINLLFAEGNPVGIKTVLTEQALIGNYLRLPLVPASERLVEQIRHLLSTLH